MKTKKQKELVASFLVTLGDDDQSLYREITLYLSELGYHPKKSSRNSHSNMPCIISR